MDENKNQFEYSDGKNLNNNEQQINELNNETNNKDDIEDDQSKNIEDMEINRYIPTNDYIPIKIENDDNESIDFLYGYRNVIINDCQEKQSDVLISSIAIEPAEEIDKIKLGYYNESYKNSDKKKELSMKKFITVCLIMSLVGGSSIGISYAVTREYINDYGSENIQNSQMANHSFDNTVKTVNSLQVESATAVEIVNHVFPSVVNITTNVSGKQTYFYGIEIPYEAIGAGSGIIFYEDDEKVYIVTNNHVINNATGITVSMTGDEELEAKVVGTDESGEVAVISILKSDLIKEGIDSVKVATFGDSDATDVGESVIAIGNALGQGKTSTGGMISSKSKEIVIGGNKLQVIQTDSAINPGNSGGALVNYKGEVIGINTAKSYETAVEGMGYAIPSNSIVPIIDRLVIEGTAPKPYLGIAGKSITNELAEIYELPIGVLIIQVFEHGPAHNAGIEEGDIITDLDNEKITDMETLIDTLTSCEIGDEVNIRIIRNGSEVINKVVTILDANA